jgi:endoglucanase
MAHLVESPSRNNLLDRRKGQAIVTMLFQNFLAATALVSSAFAAPAAEKRQSKLQWFGINESGAEFGEKNFTGVYGKEYTWYDLNTIDQFIDEGMNMFRLNLRKKASHPQTLYMLLTK